MLHLHRVFRLGSLFLILTAGFHLAAAQAPLSQPNAPSSSRAPDELTLRLQQVQAAQQTGDPSAIATANKALIATALQRIGELQMAEAAPADAISSLQQSLEYSNSIPARSSLALAYMQAGRTSDALTQADVLLSAYPKSADAWNIKGRALMDQKEYSRAADALQRSLSLDPNPFVAYALGLAYLDQKQYEKTGDIFQKLIDASENSPSAYIMVGRAYQDSGMPDEAAAKYQKAIEIDPAKSRGHYFLGLLYLMQNEWAPNAQAREQFMAEVAVNPKDFFGNFFMGYIDSADNALAESDRYLRVAAEAKPDWPEPWLYLGVNAFARNDTQHAEQYMRKAIALTGTDNARNNYQIRKAYYILGRILIQRGDREEGATDVKLFKEMEEKNMEMSRNATPAGASGGAQAPGGGGMKQQPSVPASAIINPSEQMTASRLAIPKLSPDEQKEVKQQEQQLRVILGSAFNDLGTSEARTKDYTSALADFLRAEHWNPDTPRLMRNIGLAAFRANNYPEAARALRVVVAQDPQDKLAQSMLAMSLFSSDQFVEAAKAFDQLGDSAYSDPRIAYAWAYSLAHANDPLKASSVLEKLTAQPLSPDMLLLVGQVYSSIGDNVHALSSLQKASLEDPSLPKAHYFAGLALIKLDRPNDAIPEFQAELKLKPDDPDTQYNLAYAMLQTSRRDEALAILRPLVNEHPNQPMAQYQLGKTLLDMGEVSDAIPHLEAAAHANPNLDYVHYQLQMAYRKAGRTADADREAKVYRELKDQKRNANPQSPH